MASFNSVYSSITYHWEEENTDDQGSDVKSND